MAHASGGAYTNFFTGPEAWDIANYSFDQQGIGTAMSGDTDNAGRNFHCSLRSHGGFLDFIQPMRTGVSNRHGCSLLFSVRRYMHSPSLVLHFPIEAIEAKEVLRVRHS